MKLWYLLETITHFRYLVRFLLQVVLHQQIKTHKITAANATNTKLDTVITHVDGIETLLGSQATAAKQDTGNTSVASIDTKMTTLLSQTD